MKISIVCITAGLSSHIKVTYRSIKIVINSFVNSYWPIWVWSIEEWIAVPIRDQDILWIHRLVPVHILQDLEQLLHDLLLAPAADHVVVAPQNCTDQHIGPTWIILATRLQVLPDLELATRMRINIHDVMVVIPECCNITRELDENFDIPWHMKQNVEEKNQVKSREKT